MTLKSRPVVMLPSRFDLFHATNTVTSADASAMVARAVPLAHAVLSNRSGNDTLPMPVRAIVTPDFSMAPYGQFMGAWPIMEDQEVHIFTLPNWGFFLALIEASLSPLEHVVQLSPIFLNRSRIWIGIMNDVLQCFVNNPPEGTYSMIRHHALMLFAATLWLPEPWRRQWFDLYEAVAEWACRNWTVPGDPADYLYQIESRAFSVFRQLAPISASSARWDWVNDYQCELEAVLTYIRATCLSVAPLSRIYQSMAASEHMIWLQKMVNEDHAREDFNLEGICRILRS